jgi:hypothetical protein
MAVVKWEESRHPIAVIANEVLLRKGNGGSYELVELDGVGVRLHPGVEARALAARKNGWVQIKLASGVVGWVPRGQVLLDTEVSIGQ